MLRGLLSLLLTFMYCTAFAQSTDSYNMYRWNRANAIANNGKIDTSPWFEWWYYKVVLPETGESFFVVYGVVNPWDKNETQKSSRAYATLGDFSGRLIIEQNFPVADFTASYRQVQVNVAGNEGTDRRAKGHVVSESGDVAEWDFFIDHRWTFNAVGWATGRGITNIEWYPAQADARCSGHFTSQGKRRSFVNAPCYQDRNWGNSFPSWWTWIVSNQFNEHPDSAIAIGGGKPTFWGKNTFIEGVTIGFHHKGREYTFRPNDFDKVETKVRYGSWEVAGFSPTHRIEVSAWAPPSAFLDLQFMTPAGEIFHDYETLTGSMTVKFFERTGPLQGGWRLLDTLTSNAAGIEYGSRDTFDFLSTFSGERTIFSTESSASE